MGAFFVMLIGIPDPAEAAQVTGQITLDKSEQRADVGPGDSGIVMFTGMVSVAIVGPGMCVPSIEVMLTADANEWPATIDPHRITFNTAQMGTAQSFEAAVRVPNFTSFTYNSNVTITGRARALPGTVTYNLLRARGNISIDPYFKLSVSCDEPYYEITPGDKFMHQLIIRNEGNTRDRIRIKIDEDSLDKLTKAGRVVSLGTPMVSIEEGKEDIVPVSLTGSSNWETHQDDRLYKIKIIVRSETSVLQGAFPESHEYTLYCMERGSGMPGFDPIFALMALAVVTIAIKRVAARCG